MRIWSIVLPCGLRPFENSYFLRMRWPYKEFFDHGYTCSNGIFCSSRGSPQFQLKFTLSHELDVHPQFMSCRVISPWYFSESRSESTWAFRSTRPLTWHSFNGWSGSPPWNVQAICGTLNNGLDSWFCLKIASYGSISIHIDLYIYIYINPNQPLSIIGYQSMPYPFNQKTASTTLEAPTSWWRRQGPWTAFDGLKATRSLLKQHMVWTIWRSKIGGVVYILPARTNTYHRFFFCYGWRLCL